MTRTRTNRTTVVVKNEPMRSIVPAPRNDMPERDTTRYQPWPGEPCCGRTPTMRLPVITEAA